MRLWQNSNSLAAAAVLAAALLIALPAAAQTPNPPGGGGGGGTGCVPGGANHSVLTDNGAGGCTSDGTAVLNTGALSLGGSGTAGSLLMGNATSGTITLQPVAGVLGTVTLSLPAATDTLVGLATTGTLTNKTLTAPVLNGTITGTGVSVSGAASTLVKTDANVNAFANSFTSAGQTIATAGGTTTLTAASPRFLVLTGTLAQTVVMPDATTLTPNESSFFTINNNSSQTVTINANGGGLLYSAPAGSYVKVNLLTNAAAAGTWDIHPSAPSIATWGTGGAAPGLQMNNALSTTPFVSSGVSSATAPAFVPQRGSGTTGFGGDSTHVYGIVGGATVATLDATGVNIPAAHNYLINGTQISASNLSNGVTGSGAIVLATSPTLVTPNIGAATGTSLTVSGGATSNLIATNEGAAVANTDHGLVSKRSTNDSELYIGYRTTPSAFVIGATFTSTGAYAPIILATSDKAALEIPVGGGLQPLQTGSTTVGTCGTSPTIAAGSTDTAGEVTTGTGSPAACTISFSTTKTNAPFCTVTMQTTAHMTVYAISTTAITLTINGTGGDKVDYVCMQH